MTKYIDMVVQWFYTLSGGEVVSLILVCLAIGFAFAAVKTILKVCAGVIGFLAVLYLVAPGIYEVCLDMIQQFFVSVKLWL